MNSNFSLETTALGGIKVIQPFYQEDLRGYFLKWYERDVFAELGITEVPDEDFESCSKMGVIRGLHFQVKNPQAKLVRVAWGRVNDVVVDLRRGSPTFGKHLMLELSGENRRCLYIPAGFAHGFEALSEVAVMSYKCIGKYWRDADTGIRYDSPGLDIPWETRKPIMTDKDRNLMTFQTFIEYYGWLED